MRIFIWFIVVVVVGMTVGRSVTAIAGPDVRGSEPAGWRRSLTDLVRADGAAAQEAALARVLAAHPSCADLRDALRRMVFPPLARGYHAFSLRGRDGKDRPWLLHVPPGYRPSRPTPLLVVLHGGVSWEDVTTATLQAWVETDPLARLGRERGWLLLYPFGQDGAAWWDEIGQDAVLRQLHEVKRLANVDDDRVWLAGFSDGAGGALALAMLHPGEFAAVVACNGHPALAHLDGHLPLRLPMLANTPCLLVSTDDDEFFPVEKMRPLVEMAARAGGDLTWRETAGRHRFPEGAADQRRLVEFLERHPRDPIPPRLVCEAEHPTWGRCHWLAIDEITAAPAAPWAEDFNPVTRQEAVNFHFIADERFRGPGVRAQRVFPDSLCAHLGLQKGDVLIKLAGREIRTRDDLAAAKATLRAGADLELTVRRAGKNLPLRGRLPDPTLAFVFDRAGPAATVRARAVGNRIHLETSRAGRIRIFLHPDLVDPDRPITVIADGRGVFAGRVDPDPAYLLRDYLSRRDRSRLFEAEIILEDLW